jgi:hypothetical protein
MRPKFDIGQKVRWAGSPARPFSVRAQRKVVTNAYADEFWAYDLASGGKWESGACGIKQCDLSTWHGEDWDSEAI